MEDKVRKAIKDALFPFATSYTFLVRSGFAHAPRGTALMYDVKDPRFLFADLHDLRRATEAFVRLADEDGDTSMNAVAFRAALSPNPEHIEEG